MKGTTKILWLLEVPLCYFFSSGIVGGGGEVEVDQDFFVLKIWSLILLVVRVKLWDFLFSVSFSHSFSGTQKSQVLKISGQVLKV